jgi:RHS repeat-associated protein
VIPHEKQLFGGRRRIVKSWHRFYDPATGRYISADPIGLGGGINLYGYANQDALNFYDPTGEAVPAIVYPIIISIPIIAAIVANPPEVPDVDWPREEDECEEDPCNEILKKIREVMKELNKRYMNQCVNKKNQWVSHVPAFEGKKRQLAKLIAKAESNGCLVPSKAYEWLNTGCPSPGTDTSTSPGYR